MVDSISSEELAHIDIRIDYLPTPADIAQACADIRRQWTLNERRRRFVGDQMPDEPAPAWQPPLIDTTAFRMASTRRMSDLAG